MLADMKKATKAESDAYVIFLSTRALGVFACSGDLTKRQAWERAKQYAKHQRKDVTVSIAKGPETVWSACGEGLPA